ncbi:MAG TPA: SRPBCC domain-containing protein [Actinomycetota bacterium]|nr:SRPBCC domain-containing protein [Actinomycetota bacterium]
MSTEPIVRSITVSASPEDAFRIFTAEMTSWWPLQTHTRGDEEIKSERVVVQERVGGRIYEVLSDGSEGDWGTVTAWEPGERLVLDWKPNDEDRPYTEVEVTFGATDGGTTVTLEHRRWELLGPLADDARTEYASGWPVVFDERFGAAAGRTS